MNPYSIASIAAAETDESKGLVLQEITVTAQRRDQSLSDVPVSVTALDSAAIDQLNLTATTDLQMVAPGLTITYNSAFPLLFIRGVGTDIQSPGVESSIAVYIDGIYQSQPANILKNLNNVERVEVLRGPQGTLYGRNATGGALNIITKSPSAEWQGVVEAGTGDKGLFEVSGFVSGPISDTVRVSLSGQYYDKDGYNFNVFSGESLGDENYYSFDASIEADITENFQVKLLGNYFKRDDTYAIALSEVSGNSLGAALGFESRGFNEPRTLSIDVDPAGTFIESYQVAMRAKLSTSLVEVTSLTSYMDFDMRYRLDFDYSSATLVHARPNQYGETFTQEFQFTPGYETEKLDWIFGAFFLPTVLGLIHFLVRLPSQA